MDSSSPSPSLNAELSEQAAEALAPFSVQVRNAFQRFLTSGDMAAADEVVIAIVRDHVPSRKVEHIPAELTDESTLMGDLGIDSVSISDAVYVIEEVFDVSIGNQDLMRLRTIGDLRHFLREKLATKSAA